MMSDSIDTPVEDTINWDLVNKDPDSDDISPSVTTKIYEEREKALKPFFETIEKKIDELEDFFVKAIQKRGATEEKKFRIIYSRTVRYIEEAIDQLEELHGCFANWSNHRWYNETGYKRRRKERTESLKNRGRSRYIRIGSRYANVLIPTYILEKYNELPSEELKLEDEIITVDYQVLINLIPLESINESLEKYSYGELKNIYDDYSLQNNRIERLHDKNSKLEDRIEELEKERQTTVIDTIIDDKKKNLTLHIGVWSGIIALLFIFTILLSIYTYLHRPEGDITMTRLFYDYLPFIPLGWMLWFSIIHFSKTIDISRKYHFKHAIGKILIDFRSIAKTAEFEKEFIDKTLNTIISDPVDAFKHKKYKGTPSEELAEMVKVVQSLQALRISSPKDDQNKNQDDLE